MRRRRRQEGIDAPEKGRLIVLILPREPLVLRALFEKAHPRAENAERDDRDDENGEPVPISDFRFGIKDSR